MYRHIKKSIFFLIIIYGGLFLVVWDARAINIKLPFEKGNSWTITTDYGGSNTHVGRDFYAIDFNLPGESDFGEPILAIMDGTVERSKWQNPQDVSEGYGQYIQINHGNGYISRYAHLKERVVNVDDVVIQGQIIGYADNTGNSFGSHLHFAMYKENDEGVLEAYKPEPMSGYTEFTAGEWYTSDNELYDPNKPIVQAEVEAGVEPVNKPGFFKKITTSIKSGISKTVTGVKNFVVDIFTDDEGTPTSETPSTVVSTTTPEPTPTPPTSAPVYNAEFIPANQTLEILVGQKEQPITIKAKNTGNTDWEKQKYSLNLVGGYSAGDPYRHSSWLTGLRPAGLTEKLVAPGAIGTFQFTINLPQEVGSYKLGLQIVRQDGSRFVRVGGETLLNINIVKEKIPEPLPAPAEPEQTKPEPKVLGEKIKEVIENTVDQVVDATKDAVKAIIDLPRRVFSGGRSDGGSSSGSGSSTDENTPTQISVDPPFVKLLYPTVEFTTTTVATTTIFGIKNDATQKVSLNGNSELVSFPSSTAWQAELSFSQGSNVYEVVGENSAGDKTTGTKIEFFVDSLPPTVSAPTADFQAGIIPQITVTWSAEEFGSGIKNYDLEYRQDDGEWLELVTDTTSTQYILDVDILSTYKLKVRAEDNFGNVSDWTENGEDIFTRWPQNVVINELSWAGASANKSPSSDCTRHEWLELYNNSAESVDLDGWQVKILNSAGSSLGVINLSGSIHANDYYLLARQYGKKQALVGVEIDQLYSDIDLPDAGARLLVTNTNGEIIDELDFDGGWPQGTKTAGPVNNIYQAMGRVDSTQPGSYVDNWQTQNFITPFGKTGNCGELYGTPGRDNVGMWYMKAPSYYYYDLFQNNTLTFSSVNNPYVIGSEFTIPAGYTLEIEPGVVIIGEHPESFITIDGGLNIVGTADNPAVFTSARDATYGPFVLPSFLEGEPKAGDWSRINIKTGANVDINHAKFYYGAKSFKRTDGFFATKFLSHVLNIMGGDVEIKNSAFVNSYTHANYPEYNAVVWIDNSGGASTTVRISDSLFDVGYTAIKADKFNNGTGVEVNLENNTYQNFSSPFGPVDLSALETSTST